MFRAVGFFPRAGGVGPVHHSGGALPDAWRVLPSLPEAVGVLSLGVQAWPRNALAVFAF